MSYTEYLRRKEAAAPKVIDTTLRLDASSYTQRLKFAASRMINEANLKENEEVNVPAIVSTYAGTDGTIVSSAFSNVSNQCIDSTGLIMYSITSFTINKINMLTNQVTFIAGGGYGSADGIGAAAQFNNMHSICIDSAGLNLYVTDSNAHTVRKIVISTREVTTLAGTAGVSGGANGIGAAASFSTPYGIAIDSSGTYLYVGESQGRIRRITISTRDVQSYIGNGTLGNVDGIGTNATIGSVHGLVIDPTGLNLYAADSARRNIRRIRLSDAQTFTIAGDGTNAYLDGIGLAAKFKFPVSITIDSQGLNLYVTDSQVFRIRRIELSNNNVTTVAGDGTSGYLNGNALSATFSVNIAGVTIDPAGLNLYVADGANNRIRRITPPYSFSYFQTNIPINKAKSGGRIPDASTFTQYAGGQAVGKEVQAGMPAPRLLLNSTSAGSLSGCRTVPEPVPYNPAVGGVYSANMVRRDASQFTRDETACRQLTGEPHNANELGPSLFVDNTIVGIKNYNLPQNNSKTYTATKCTQCGNNGAELAKTCSFCIGANHLHPVDKPTNVRWGPRPRKSAQPIIVNQSPSDFHKVGAAMRKIPYVEKHHANPQIGHIIYPKTPYRIPRGTAAQLKINDPQRYPGTM